MVLILVKSGIYRFRDSATWRRTFSGREGYEKNDLEAVSTWLIVFSYERQAAI
ncbi:hypothetical protein [Maribacter flavus]|uniref:hypothetical protein n=1 Tax=Maribacter flavus TaxID=1658664 RepID=UPI001B85ECD2|nr:hypothetical protein [Maribacter flavus]